MKDNRIVTSFNKVNLPIDREDALLARILMEADMERASLEKEQEMNRETSKYTVQRMSGNRTNKNVKRRHKPMKRRAFIILVAAIILMLTACTALAIYLSTVSKLKDDAAAKAAKTEAELRADAEKAAGLIADGMIPTIPIDCQARVDDVTLCIKTIELWPMEANTQEAYLTMTFESETTGATADFNSLSEDARGQEALNTFVSFCEIGMDARDFVLTINGAAYKPYVQAGLEGMQQPAAGFNADGTFSMSFLGLPDAIPFDTEMMLSGTLYQCDSKGTRLGMIGDFSIPFVYRFTEEDREAWIASLTAESIENLQARAEARLESVVGLPEAATPINATVEEITFLDIAATEASFLIGLRYDLQRESLWGAQYLTYYINGYKVDSAAIDTKWDVAESAEQQTQAQDPAYSATLLEQVFYPAARENLPKVVTIVCMREAGTGTAPDDVTHKYSFPAVQFVLRYNMDSGEVVLPQDASEKAAWLGDTTVGSGQSDVCRIYDLAGQTQTANGVRVSILRIAALSTGKWMVCYRIEDVACENMAWETVPTIMVDGQQAAMFSKPQALSSEKIQELLDNYSMKKNRWTTDEWEIQPPSRIELMPESFTVDVSWDLFDLTNDGERELIGTFDFQIPVSRDNCTTTVDKAYLVGLDF